MAFTPGEIKYIWKHRGNKNYLLKAIKAREETVESLIFEDVKNSYEVSGKIVSFPREGEAYHWPRLMHVNLAPLLDILSINETVSIYISTVFEKSLKDTIQEEEFTNRPDCFRRKKSYAEDILWALDYLHGKSLCLMNLNEGNIYVCSRNDNAIITDFSCLTLEERATKSRVAVPTLYRAPELAASSSERFYPKATEMWACGVLMLQIFSDQVESSFDGDPDKYVLKLVQSLCGKLDESSKQGSVEECNAVDEFKIFLDLFLKVDPCSRTTASNAALSSFLRRRKETDQESGDLDLQNSEVGEDYDVEKQRSENDVDLSIKPVQSVIDIPIKRSARPLVTSEYASGHKKLNNEKYEDSLRNYIRTSTDAALEKEIISGETDIEKSENNSGMPRQANSKVKIISNEKVSHLSMPFNRRKYANLSEPIKNSKTNEKLHGKNSSTILPHNQDKSTNNELHPLNTCISDSSIDQPSFPTEDKQMYGKKGSAGSWKTDTLHSSEDEVYSTDSLEVPSTVSKSKESLSTEEKLKIFSENNPLHTMEDSERCFSGNLRNTNNREIRQESVGNDSLKDDGVSRIQIHRKADTVSLGSLNISPHMTEATLTKNETGYQEDLHKMEDPERCFPENLGIINDRDIRQESVENVSLDTVSLPSLNTSYLYMTEQVILPKSETLYQEDLHKIEDPEQCFPENLGITNNRDPRQESVENVSLEDDWKSQIRIHSEADTVSLPSLNITEQETLLKNDTGHQEDVSHNYKLLYRNGETLDSGGKKEDLKRKTIFEDDNSSPLLISIKPLHSPIPQKQISTSSKTEDTFFQTETDGILIKKERNEFYRPKDSSYVGGVSNSGFDCAVGDFAPSGDTLNNGIFEEKLNKRSPSNSAAKESSGNDASMQCELEKKSRKWFVNRCGELEPSDIDFFEKPEKKKKKREKSKFEKKSWFYHFCPGCQARGDEAEMLCSYYST